MTCFKSCWFWALHFDWEISGNYDWTSLYFNFDGTFPYLVRRDDVIILRFKRQPETDSKSVYSGTASRNFMSGLTL